MIDAIILLLTLWVFSLPVSGQRYLARYRVWRMIRLMNRAEVAMICFGKICIDAQKAAGSLERAMCELDINLQSNSKLLESDEK